MTIALQSFRAWPEYPESVTREKGVQYAFFQLTAASADNILDFGTDTSALWTALDATAAGKNAHTVMKQIAAATSGILSVTGPQLFTLVPAVTAGAGLVVNTIVNNRPVLTLDTAAGLTAWQILITWRLTPPNERGYTADYST